MLRLLTTMLGLVLAAWTMGTPAQARAGAPPRTIMVDGDGQADRRSCGGRTPSGTSIQAAIEAASSGDRVVVCPGTYREALRFGPGSSGVTLEAKAFWRAVLAPVVPGGDAISVDGATGVTILGIAIRPVGGVAQLVIPVGPIPVVPICTPAASAVRVGNGGATSIRSVRISTAPACGYREGIVIDGARSVVTHSRVTDFLVAGISAGPGSELHVSRTDIRFLHQDRSGALIGDRIDDEVTGIAVDGAASATVYRSGVFSVRPRNDVVRPQLWAGIAIRDVAGTVRIQRTSVSRTLRAGFLVLRSPQVTLVGVLARDSWQDGIYLDELEGATVLRGRAARNGRGIAVGSGARDITIRDLRSLDSRLLDCHDASTGSESAGTANRWERVVGETSEPRGLCTADGSEG